MIGNDSITMETKSSVTWNAKQQSNLSDQYSQLEKNYILLALDHVYLSDDTTPAVLEIWSL
jgi:hypothetical protein